MSANDELQAHTCEKILQEYGNVANNVAQSKVQDLTEKWKKGELEADWYYVKNEFGNIFISDYSEDYDYIGDKVVKDFFTEVSEITEVLAPVPSYEEWQKVLNIDFNNEVLRLENAKLKELLYSLKCCLTSENIEPQIRIDKSLGKIDNVIGEKK